MQGAHCKAAQTTAEGAAGARSTAQHTDSSNDQATLLQKLRQEAFEVRGVAAVVCWQLLGFKENQHAFFTTTHQQTEYVNTQLALAAVTYHTAPFHSGPRCRHACSLLDNICSRTFTGFCRHTATAAFQTALLFPHRPAIRQAISAVSRSRSVSPQTLTMTVAATCGGGSSSKTLIVAALAAVAVAAAAAVARTSSPGYRNPASPR